MVDPGHGRTGACLTPLSCPDQGAEKDALDLVATGHIRFLAGTESLLGFMMITWSAFFSHLIMARTWGERRN